MADTAAFTLSPIFWEKLRQMNPEDVCRRAAVNFDGNSVYAVEFMGKEYRVNMIAEHTEGPVDVGSKLASSPEFNLLLLTYLTTAQDVPFLGKRISEKELPGGHLFFRGPHALPFQPLIERFGNNPGKFLEIGLTLGGSSIAYGDAAFELLVLPRITVAFILWAEDEEFSATVTFLFDSSLASHLPLDAILALVRSVVTYILRTGE